jgi:hypothetical protein
VFNVTSLEHYRESRIPGRRQEPPPPDEIEGEKFWVVEGIAKSVTGVPVRHPVDSHHPLADRQRSSLRGCNRLVAMVARGSWERG